MDRGRMFNLCGFRHLHMEDTILEFCINTAFINAVDVEGTAHRTHAAFTADVIALVVLITGFTLLLSRYGEITVLIAELYILFLHARQICRQLITVTVILHIDPHTAIGIEARHGGEEIIMEKATQIIEKYPTIDSIETCLQALTEFAHENKRAVFHIYHSVNREMYEYYLWKLQDRSAQSINPCILPKRNYRYLLSAFPSFPPFGLLTRMPVA